MFETETNQTQAPASAAFEDALALIKLAADPKAYQKQLDGLMAATVKASEAKAAAARQEASLAVKEAAQNAAFAKREGELDAYHGSLLKRESETKQTRQTIFGALAEMQRLDAQMRRAVMGYGGLLEGFNERLQELPSWEALGNLLGRSDVHFDESAQPDRGEASGETERLPDAPMMATIRRSKPPRPSRQTAA
jgi:hypothetical protein